MSRRRAFLGGWSGRVRAGFQLDIPESEFPDGAALEACVEGEAAEAGEGLEGAEGEGASEGLVKNYREAEQAQQANEGPAPTVVFASRGCSPAFQRGGLPIVWAKGRRHGVTLA